MSSSGSSHHNKKSTSRLHRSIRAKQIDKVDVLFNRYAEKRNKQLMGPDGIEALCKDMKIEPMDIRILLLAWKLEAAKQGFFTLQEWQKGLRVLKADSTERLIRRLTGLQEEITSNPEEFNKLYTFSFHYCCIEPMQKTLDIETACAMLQVVLSGRSHLESFVRFLQEQREFKALNLDQWTSFLRFCDKVNADMSDFDESEAWPVLIDDYVLWFKTSPPIKKSKI